MIVESILWLLTGLTMYSLFKLHRGKEVNLKEILCYECKSKNPTKCVDKCMRHLGWPGMRYWYLCDECDKEDLKRLKR